MSTRETAAAYFDAWKAHDSDRFRALLADHAVWEGPTSKAAGAEDIMLAFQAAASHVTQLQIQHVWVDGDEALTWFRVTAGGTAPRPVANWMTTQGGLVVHVRATSDLTGPAGPAGSAP